MYIEKGIAYAGEKQPILKVIGVRPLDNYKLWIHFSNDQIRIFDVKPLLDKYPLFQPLKDKQLFQTVYIDYGTVVWANGDIDIETEMLLREGKKLYPETKQDKVIVADN